MKYLVRFNESYTFKDLCNDSLTYLIDDGFGLYINEDGYYINICLYRKGIKRTSPYLVYTSDSFTWDEINNDFIPFLQLYKSTYPRGQYSIKSMSIISCNGTLSSDTGYNDKIYINFENILNNSMDDYPNVINNIDNIQLTLYKN